MRQALEQAAKARVEAAQQARRIFDRCAGRSPGVDGQFAVSDGIVSKVVSRAARLADISVLGSGASYGADGWEDVREGALFGSGRPILLAPPGGIEERHFERVVIAWKDGIEAARAIAAVQPFLLRAKEVYLLTVGQDEPSVTSLQNVEQYLQLHHSEVRSESLSESGKTVGEVLIEKSNNLGAMLAMGAYSHWRWQERIFGGVTDHVLRQSRTPVLMAH
jgi:nucleotide-binding universal stress UspA family protein